MLSQRTPVESDGQPQMSRCWSESVVDLVTGRLALLADPTRVRLLMLLGQGEASVQALSETMTSTPQNVSRHLGHLYRAGIVSRRRDGMCVIYSLTDFSTCLLLDKVLECITGQVEELADVVNLTG
jgi:DNA-binding transcriptional ArsR family regulator